MGATVTSKILDYGSISCLNTGNAPNIASLGFSEQPVNHGIHNLLLQIDRRVSVRSILLLDSSYGLSEETIGNGQDVGLVDDCDLGRTLWKAQVSGGRG